MISCGAYDMQASEESQKFTTGPSPHFNSFPGKSFSRNPYSSNYLSYENPYQHFYVSQQSAPSFATSSQSSESGVDTNSTVNSFQTFQTNNGSTLNTNLMCAGSGFLPPPVDYSDSQAAEETKPTALPREVIKSEQFGTEEVPTKADDGSDLSSLNSNTEQQTFMKQDPSQVLIPLLSASIEQMKSMHSGTTSKGIQYFPVSEATQFNKRGLPKSKMGGLSLCVTEYWTQMPRQKLTMLSSKCLADECGFVVVFEVPEISALALAYFNIQNLSVCDVVFTNSRQIISSRPNQFTGHFICMLRRTKSRMVEKLKNVVIDDILSCRPWFTNKNIEFITINPILSDAEIICERKQICVGQSLNVHFSLNACNPSALYFHPEAKNLQFDPKMVIIPPMSKLSLPVKITPLDGCSLRPHIRLNICDLNENEEKIGLVTPFIVLPKIASHRVIRGYEVIYVDDDKTCLRVLDELNMISSGFVFLDTEWKPMSAKQHNKIALIQICAGKKCYLIHIHKFHSIPHQLFHFLASPTVIKIGLAISYDAKKFHDDYRQPMGPVLDLRDFTWFQDRDKKSLNFLVQNLLKEPNRTKKCTLSNWENDLDSLQIEYAALDVIFMSEIFEKLFGNDISMQKYAIGMFGQRNPALTKNTIHSQRVLPVKAEPNHVDDTPKGSIDLVDANGNIQYKITEKRARRLLMLGQAKKISEKVFQLQ